MPYHMDVETAEGVKPHGFHLGTNLRVAEGFVHEKLKQPEVMSVALRLDNELVRVYDFRDLPGFAGWHYD